VTTELTTGTALRAGAGAGAATVPARLRRRRWWRTACVLGLALLAVLAVRAQMAGPADARDGTTAVSRDGMAAAHGIDVTMVAVTAAQGLVDLRYQVVDVDKASALLHDDSLSPILVAEDTGATLRMAHPPGHHGAELRLGGSYFFLLANAHTALRAGSKVTLVIGDSRLEHVTVQG
jgi:hypothetical protein